MRRVWPVALLLFALAGPADAANGCSFQVTGATWTLDADCTTDIPIVVPDGFTLDGAQHTITAVDPPGGRFRGGIIVADGAAATVINTVITALMLAEDCQIGGDRLRAIYFDGASGAIRGNTILNVNRSGSSCQDGNGIEIRNTNRDGRSSTVEIIDNVVEGFQKTGIVASGRVDATVRGNRIGASAAQRLLVANGIQAGAGAHALIEGNTVAGNSWGGEDAAGTAILLVNTAPGTEVRGNVIAGNADVGIYILADDVRVERNRLTDSGTDGAFDVGIGNYGQHNVFEGNSISGFYIPYQNVTEPPSPTTVAAYPSRDLNSRSAQ